VLLIGRLSAPAALLFLVLQACAPHGGDSGCDAAPSPRADPQPASGALSVISWNVHGLPFDASLERRVESIAGEIRRKRPDLVLLQEAWLEGDAERIGCSLRSEYERVADAERVRSGLLSLFGHRRGGLLALVRRDSPWKLDPAQPGFEEYAAAAPWYRLDELDGIAGKGVQSFAIGDGARRVMVLNTHLQAQYPARGNRYEDLRMQQITQLLAHVSKEIQADALLVAGDFNTRDEESAHYGALTNAFDDLTASFRHSCACGTYIARDGAEGWWIDYVFARRVLGGKIVATVERIRNHKRDDPYSDHHGLWLELDLAR
jgi:endonuclease/exonuclease/phosphatase family metal-dependent hydrolase